MFDLSEINYKKAVLVILTILISIGIIVGITYFVFIKKRLGPEANVNGGLPGGQLPGTGEGFNANIGGGGGQLPGVGSLNINGTIIESPPLDQYARGSNTVAQVISDSKVNNIAAMPGSNAVVYYDAENAKFYRYNDDGTTSLLSNKEFYSVEKVTWSKDRTRAIIEYPDDSKIFYDFVQDKAVTLPKEVQDPAFSPNGEQLAYKYESSDPQNSWLVVSKPDGTEAQRIEPIGDKGDQVQVAWSPDNKVVALYRASVSVSQEEVLPIGQNDENFKSLLVDGFYFQGAWNPNGSKLLYQVVSAASDYNPTLWVADANTDSLGSGKMSLGLNTTIDKCVFSSDNATVYCAVPTSMETGSGLAPDLRQDTNDVIYKIDLVTGLKNLIANPLTDQGQGNFSIGSLVLTKDEDSLVFWDEKNNQAYKIKLK